MKGILFPAWRRVAAWSRPSERANLRQLRERGEIVDALVIRDATAADVEALARLHVITWNATYAPFLIKGPSVEIREWQWRQAFEKQDGNWFCFVGAS